MLKILVKKWLDQETKEADLLVLDDNINFIAYCSRYIASNDKNISLQSLYSSNITLAYNAPQIAKDDASGFYSYIVVAKVLNIDPPCVELTNTITIELDCALPCDIKKGQFIQFSTARLSLWYIFI